MRRSLCRWWMIVVYACFILQQTTTATRAQLQVGAAIVDVSPTQLPVIVNGGMTSNMAQEIRTRVNARAMVLSDGNERIAIVVVDSCMMPKELLDEAKQLASTRTQLQPNRILISATHSHSAPSSMGALGTDADPNYIPLLRQRLVEAIETAEKRLQPAEVGWGKSMAPEFTALRRWVRRPDRVALDPFGNPTVRANMHAARNPDDAIGPTGPEDPELTMIAFRGTQDKLPIAVLTNFSMHYFGDAAVSADYFGLFCDGLQNFVRDRHPQAKDFVAAMSHGCSGDIWRRDYFLPPPSKEQTIVSYTQGLLDIAIKIYDSLQFSTHSDLAMAETRLPMSYRVPDAQRLEWSQRIVEQIGDRLPKNEREVYAREQVILHERQTTDIVLQAIRVGDIAIASTPNETYALTGIKLKLQSPLEKTMVIELANGGDGYIPPPEQHFLGGYNTWAARSAGLEVTAEPRIVATHLGLLEKVCKKPRRIFEQTAGTTAKSIHSAKPIAYWRLNDFKPPIARDDTGFQRNGTYESGVLFFLEGDDRLHFTDGPVNRSTHFAGGRMRAELPLLNGDFTLAISFWNGMPEQARDIAGWMFSRDHEYVQTSAGIHLGLGGKGEEQGRLLLQIGDVRHVANHSPLKRWSWHQAVLVRNSAKVKLFLDGTPEPVMQLDGPAEGRLSSNFFFGGHSTNLNNWEGRLDEIAIFDRELSIEEITSISK
jgi:Neutral/alkaline non-lysosomal ceramidase, N-terminal/Concanavalin A-like lectin/glucanases superfamily